MSKKSFNNFVITLILVLGAIFRLVLFSVSPPNNTFDDHLAVINLYAQSVELPAPSQCWECYQPPTYYILSALVYKVAESTNTSNLIAWKFVQLINTILSILVLILFYKIISRFNLSDKQRILYMSFMAILPVDIFTSSMIGNDYLLVFSTVAALYYYLKNIELLNNENKISFSNFIYLTFFVVLGGLSKQHGLILLAFPAFIVLTQLIRNKRAAYTILIPFLLVGTIISVSNEFWKYNETGKILVSNQHFFDYAKNQFPGSLDQVEFTSFHYFTLLQEPFISDQTAASFPTEIFARTFFDYEWRFLSPKIPFANVVGRLAYCLGVIWLIYILGMVVLLAWGKKNIFKTLKLVRFTFLVPVFVGLLFMIVPVMQTIRYPYFSSMKTTFMLPGLIVLLAMHAFATKNIKLPTKGVAILVSINVVYGVILILTIYTYIGICIGHLHGPLWVIPVSL
jgi:hypothetical protein